MWIDKKEYDKQINKWWELEREYNRLKEKLTIYEQLTEPLILGQFFLAEKQQQLQGMFVWTIYRVDKLIKSEKPEIATVRAYICTVYSESAAQMLVKYFDEKVLTILTNKLTRGENEQTT